MSTIGRKASMALVGESYDLLQLQINKINKFIHRECRNRVFYLITRNWQNLQYLAEISTFHHFPFCLFDHNFMNNKKRACLWL